MFPPLAGHFRARQYLAEVSRPRRPRTRHQAHSRQPGDHPRERRNVDAGHDGQVDLALAVITRERREYAPHRNAQPMSRQRAAPEIDHQRRSDAIDQVGKIFAEIEIGTAGHE